MSFHFLPTKYHFSMYNDDDKEFKDKTPLPYQFMVMIEAIFDLQNHLHLPCICMRCTHFHAEMSHQHSPQLATHLHFGIVDHCGNMTSFSRKQNYFPDDSLP